MSDNKELPLETIGLSAQLEGKGVSVGVRTRLTTAVDRLLGGLVNFPSWYLEAAKARHDAKTAATVALIEARSSVQISLVKAEGEAAAQRFLGLTDAGVRVLDSFLREEERKQVNREAVAFEAIQALEAATPRQEESREGETPADLGPDWINFFMGYAEKASSDDLRKLWGRVLAGEARKPKSFSLSTLRVVSEMDAEVAEIFEKALAYRIGRISLFRERNVGPSLPEMLDLEERGLVQGAAGTLTLSLPIRSDGYFYVTSGDFLLRSKMLAGQEPPLVAVAKLSRVGAEIASIIPAQNPELPLREAAEFLRDTVESMDLVRVVKHSESPEPDVVLVERLK